MLKVWSKAKLLIGHRHGRGSMQVLCGWSSNSLLSHLSLLPPQPSISPHSKDHLFLSLPLSPVLTPFLLPLPHYPLGLAHPSSAGLHGEPIFLHLPLVRASALMKALLVLMKSSRTCIENYQLLFLVPMTDHDLNVHCQGEFGVGNGSER